MSVILPGIFSTFSVFLMYRFFAGIPEEVLEAARMDGANEWQVFCHIGVPLGYAGIISAMAAAFVALLPALFVFLYGQDYLERGITETVQK